MNGADVFFWFVNTWLYIKEQILTAYELLWRLELISAYFGCVLRCVLVPCVLAWFWLGLLNLGQIQSSTGIRWRGRVEKLMIWLKRQKMCWSVCLTDCYSLQPSVLPSVFPGLSPAQTSVMAMGGVSRARRRGRDAWRSSNRKIPLLYQHLVLNTFELYCNMFVI